jgi:hypothetical protein
MPSTNHYNGFDVIRVDANGFRVPMPATTVRINAGAYTAVTSDAFGHVADGSIASTTDGDVVTFDVSGYAGTLNRTLHATLADAEAEMQNAIPTLVLENLAAEKVAKSVDLWVEDTTNPDSVPQFLGSGQPGTTVEFPYITPEARSLTIHSNPKYDDGSSKYLNFNLDS